MKRKSNQGYGFSLRAKAALRYNHNKSSFVEIPNQWYNLVADLSVKPPPPLHPKTFEPIKPEDLSHLFPNELIKQEATLERFIDIPEEVLEIYKLWRPTPLIRFLFFSYDSVLHKPESESVSLTEVSLLVLTDFLSDLIVLALILERRDWRSYFRHLQGFTSSMKVVAQLVHTNPTQLFRKLITMRKKASRTL